MILFMYYCEFWQEETNHAIPNEGFIHKMAGLKYWHNDCWPLCDSTKVVILSLRTIDH